ncbi:MAG: metallophosphoesterase [Anaerolineales bacterium]|nr:metallophosphoesterase [Anaerolineales bacterium]
MKSRKRNYFPAPALALLVLAAVISGCRAAGSLGIGLSTALPSAEECDTPDPDVPAAPEICTVPGLHPPGGDAPGQSSEEDGTKLFIPMVEAPEVTPPGTPAGALPAVTQSATPAPSSLPPTPEGPDYDPVTFAVFGDYGRAGGPEADVAALVKSRGPDIILTTGDNNYPAGLASTIDENVGQYYHEYIYPYQGGYGEGARENRFFPTLGNHDWDTGGVKPYLDYFTLPGNERYYDFVWGPVHFFAIDSDSREPDGVSAGSIQAEWLRDGLAAAEEPWKVVYMHHPAYTSGRRGNVAWMQWPFAEWGADVVMAGHDHVYERLEIGGITYITTGLGGFGPYNFGDPIPGSQVRYQSDYGALFVTATEDAMTFEFVTRAGEVVDAFTISGP